MPPPTSQAFPQPTAESSTSIATDYQANPSPDRLVFTCTFCWHLSSGAPRVLGRRSARLACEPCYAALVDLAVCWVCGEVVFRGDEAVSLGWCFWHRACYGCLLCGSKLVVAGPTVAEVFRDGGGAASSAVEIQEIPMCGYCVVSCEADSLDRDAVAQKALRRVDGVDGGLTRKRWERHRDGTASRKATGAIRRVPGRISKAAEGLSTRYQQPPPPSQGHSYQPQITGDGALSRQTGSNESSLHCVVPLDSTIYVSIFDPINEPAFKPSPTKPIPRWMRMLPGQRSQYRKQQQPRPHSILDVHFRPPSTISIKTPPSSSAPHVTTTTCPTTTTTTTTTAPVPAAAPVPPSSPLRRRKSWESMGSHYSERGASPETRVPFATFKGPSFVADEHLQRPFSRAVVTSPPARPSDNNNNNNNSDDASGGGAAAFSTPEPPPREAYPQTAAGPDAALPARHRGYPRASPSSPSPPLTEQVAAHLRRRAARRTPPAQSTEFLSLYRAPRAAGPTAAPSSPAPGASAAVPGRGRGRVVGEGRRAVVREMGRTREGGVVTVARMGGGGGGRRRSGLQDELRRLFGGGVKER